MSVLDVIDEIERDFENKNGPFDSVEFPEERLLRELAVDESGETWRMPMEWKLSAISLFSSLDYNRDANQLVNKILEATEHDSINILNPHEVDMSQNAVENLFEEISFRYPSRDAHTWNKNCRILTERYNGKWHELLLTTGCDATKLVQRLEKDDFNVLKGVKVAPMYARIIDDVVCDLSNMWRLDIPVDTHIRQLSKDLFQDSDYNWFEPLSSDDEIREIWREIGEEHDINRHVVDGALWHIGNKWDTWGKDYWESKNL